MARSGPSWEGQFRCWGRSVEFPTISSLPFHEYDISSAVNLNATQTRRSGRNADSPAFGFWQQAPNHASPVRRRERRPGAGLFKGNAEGRTRGEASNRRLAGVAPKARGNRTLASAASVFPVSFSIKKGTLVLRLPPLSSNAGVTLGREGCPGCRSSFSGPLFLPL